MYLEVIEFLQKIKDLLSKKITYNESNELEHILFQVWSAGYQAAVKDIMDEQKR